MVGIDEAHAKLITGLIVAFKPNNVLELGYGDGVSHDAIMEGASFNQNKPRYTLVDSWHDWNFKQPTQIVEKTHAAGETVKSFNVITSAEKDFVKYIFENSDYATLCHRFDFIMSDADHQQTDQWALQVYDQMLTSPGILIYHDVAKGYDNLKTIKPNIVKHFNTSQIIEFARSTRKDEECERGLLLIYKP